MEYVFKVNQSSTDARVKKLAEVFQARGYTVEDIRTETTKKAIYFIEPRTEVAERVFQNVPQGSLVFGYPKTMTVPKHLTYISLNDDEDFIRANNRLTAQALQQIILHEYHGRQKKMLICGWGKLANEIVQVFKGWDIAILNFNFHKVADLRALYGPQAYFEQAPFETFPVIVNTIPKPLIKPATWQKRRAGQKIFELASQPYGFDWTGVDHTQYNYQILPGLPGKYYPAEAAAAVAAAIDRYLRQIAKPQIVLCITGSACSYTKLLPVLTKMVERYEIYPVISPHADLPNRFTDIEKFKQSIRDLTGHNLITNIAGAETLSSNSNLVASVVFPATGNTLAKLTHGITDTCVLMAVKALLRNDKPCVLGIATNDALSGNAKNIGELLNRKNIYFVPFGQDNVQTKPRSCVCDFNQVIDTIDCAIKGQQIQPILLH